MRTSMTGRIARSAARRPLITVSVWVVALVSAIYAAGGLGDALTQDDRLLVTTESQTAQDIHERERGHNPGSDEVQETVVVEADQAKFGDASFTAALTGLATTLEGIEGVEEVSMPTAAEPYPVSETGDVALLSLTVIADESGTLSQQLLDSYASASTDGFAVRGIGELTAGAEYDRLAEEGLIRGEAIGIGVALLILMVVFGALVAAGIPLLVGIVSIVLAVGATAVVGQAFEASFFVVNMITMMGLALGVDYSLVAVQRFREELARGHSVIDAVTATGSTANRAVLFSGTTVVISLVGLLIVPSTVMRSLGVGAIIVATMSVVAALTLLPAVLALLGHRVNKGRLPFARPSAEPRRWQAFAKAVTSRPIASSAAGLVILLLLAAPALSMRLAFPGVNSLPEDNNLRIASETLVTDFGLGQNHTMVVIEDAAQDTPAIEQLAQTIEADPAFAHTTVTWAGDTAFIDAQDLYDSADPRAEQAIDRLRDTHVPAALADSEAVAHVGGDQAHAVDFSRVIGGMTPWVLAIVLTSSFILLLVAFRSVVVPVVAIGLNLLSTAAAFGMLVIAFQTDWGSALFGFPQVDGIAPWIPLFLFAVLFGLSMDYHVFLLSRMKERFDATGNNLDSITYGLSRTGSLITGAALIMVAVFSGFALGDLAEFAQMGFGLAAAVILDATVIRSLLVPALMTLLGRANWYLPTWLNWLPHVRVEGPATPVNTPAVGGEPTLVRT